MEQITAYKLSNGQIVENAEEAERLEKEISFKSRLKEVILKEVAYEDNREIVERFILDNREDLTTLLTERTSSGENTLPCKARELLQTSSVTLQGLGRQSLPARINKYLSETSGQTGNAS